MVEAAEPDAFDALVALTAGVTVAVVSRHEASGAAADDGEAADAPLQDRRRKCELKLSLPRTD